MCNCDYLYEDRGLGSGPPDDEEEDEEMSSWKDIPEPMNAFCFRASWYRVVEELSPEQGNALLMAILEYAFLGKYQEGGHAIEFAMKQIEWELDRQRERYNTCRANGSKGGRPPKAKERKIGRPKIPCPPNFPDIYAKWASGGVTGVQAMKELSLKSNTFYRLVSEYRANQG